jgi:predicted GNAT family acetyltransferase
MDTPVVKDNPGESRYEVYVDDDLAGFVTYRLDSDVIAFLHTQVSPEFQGGGVASALVREALDDARARGLAVLPFCPYVSAWIRRHPEYADLVSADQRARFALT